MVGLATQTVNTNINWPGLVVSLASFIACMAGIVTFIDRKQDRRATGITEAQNAMRAEFTKALNNAAELLSERLETKDNVNQLRVEVAKLSAQLQVMVTVKNGNLHVCSTKTVVDTKWRQSCYG